MNLGFPRSAPEPPIERRALDRWLDKKSLTREEAEALFSRLMDGEISDPLKAALLVALRMKGESPLEIAGAAAAMRARSSRIPHALSGVVDTCGTGGDRRGTFNISTAAAFVAAAGGVPIAKHGNRSVSSRSGSADVLEALGLRLDVPPERAGAALAEVGVAFLFAPALHPAMRELMPVRRELGLRTVFNLLGPLTNPAGARRQVLGVYAAELVEPMARVLVELEAEHALVVHGDDGLDEITTTTATTLAEVRAGTVSIYRVRPEELGLVSSRLVDLEGGDASENAARMRRVLAGESGPLADVVAANAGAALYVGDRAPDLGSGVAAARSLLASGRPWEKFERLRRFLE